MPELERSCNYIKFNLPTGLSKPKTNEEHLQEYVKYEALQRPKQTREPQKITNVPSEELQQEKGFLSWIYILIGVVILGLIAGGIYYFLNRHSFKH